MLTDMRIEISWSQLGLAGGGCRFHSNLMAEPDITGNGHSEQEDKQKVIT